ncbi:MAG: c-type cytochrome [Armatimonadota bacterium]
MQVRPTAAPKPLYRSPHYLAFAPSGTTLAVSDHTARQIVLVEVSSRRVAKRIPIPGQPEAVAWRPDGSRLYAAVRDPGTVLEISPTSGAAVRRLSVPPRPQGIAIDRRGRTLVVCSPDTNTVSVIDLSSGRQKGLVGVPGQPHCTAVTPNGALAVVGCLLPAGSAVAPNYAAAVALVSLSPVRLQAVVKLQTGASLVRSVCVSPDGRWAYAVHTLGRTNVPTTQLHRGWVNTNALSIIDLHSRQRYATVLLDDPLHGAANPWSCVLSQDGRALWVTISGTHEIAKLDLQRLENLLSGNVPADDPATALSEEYKTANQPTWLEIRRDPSKKVLLADDLTALSIGGVLSRASLPCRGPRGASVSPDGKLLAVSGYYSGDVVFVDPVSLKPLGKAALGPPAQPDLVRRGEAIFDDGEYCFQGWLTCATCHPDGRTDGLNWDLLNDGIGNPKNTKSLVLSHKTPPAMAHGVRASMDVAAEAGFRFILFREPRPDDLAAVRAYIRSLRPELSPYLTTAGTLSPQAKRGKAVFQSPRTKCASCHPAPLYTDLRLHNVGTRGPSDTSGDFDTPTLVELWRTAPYLHDGSAPTLMDVLTTRNKEDKHGITSHLPKEDKDALAAFLSSL